MLTVAGSIVVPDTKIVRGATGSAPAAVMALVSVLQGAAFVHSKLPAGAAASTYKSCACAFPAKNINPSISTLQSCSNFFMALIL
jgi:hypothetical protein